VRGIKISNVYTFSTLAGDETKLLVCNTMVSTYLTKGSRCTSDCIRI
jgi:hypothetical protein